MDEHEQADAMSNDTLPGNPTRPQTFETQPLGSPVINDAAPSQEKVTDGDAESQGGKDKKSFNPWRFQAITLPPDARRELLQMELPRIPEDQLYHAENLPASSATASPSPIQDEAADAGTEAERRADTLRNLRAVAPVSYVRPALSPLVKVVLIGFALGALLTVGSYFVRAPSTVPSDRAPRDGQAAPTVPAAPPPPALNVEPPATHASHGGNLAMPSPTTTEREPALAESSAKAEDRARPSKRADDRRRARPDVTRPGTPASSRPPPAAPPSAPAEQQDNGNWFKIRD